MSEKLDEEFYQRADAHIQLSNSQIEERYGRGKVSASMMYAAARFNAWVSACGFIDPELMRTAKGEAIDYFVGEYRKMLEANFDDYIDNYEMYMKPPASEEDSNVESAD